MSVTGTANIVDDKQKAEELWDPFLKQYFPEGLDEPQLRLLKITVLKAEYWDVYSSMQGYVLTQLHIPNTHQDAANAIPHHKEGNHGLSGSDPVSIGEVNNLIRRQQYQKHTMAVIPISLYIDSSLGEVKVK